MRLKGGVERVVNPSAPREKAVSIQIIEFITHNDVFFPFTCKNLVNKLINIQVFC